ncbi:MAG: cell division protein FtsQ/DivIB [Pseudomonadota bacterium]
MPKVRSYEDDEYDMAPRRNDASVSSIVFGLMIIVALVVSAAAWMGGSMSKVEAGVGNALDTVARSTGLAVETVVVLGLDEAPALRDDVRALAMIEPGENMWRADPHRIRTRIEGSGKVVNVTVHRLWPSQVVVTASPATPTALWHDGASWQVVDTRGRVMRDEPPARYADLLKVSGDGGEAAMPDLKAALEAAPSLDGRIQMARLVDGRRWDVLLDTGVVVRLPGRGHLAEALDRFEALNRSEQIADRAIALADFRLRDRVFLRPSAAPGAAPAEGAA